MSARGGYENRFVNSVIELFIGNVQGLVGELVEGGSQTLRTCAASFSRWSRMGVEGIMLTSSLSRKLRPTNFSITVLAEAGGSRAKLIETFSITPCLHPSFLPGSNGSQNYLMAALQRTRAGQAWERQF
jgi:hypothetical protein